MLTILKLRIFNLRYPESLFEISIKLFTSLTSLYAFCLVIYNNFFCFSVYNECLSVFTEKKYPKATGLACLGIDEYNVLKKERKSILLMKTVLAHSYRGCLQNVMIIIHDYWVDDKTKPDFFTLGAEKFQFALSVATH